MGLELFNTLILLLLVVAALIALRVKDLLTASVVFAVYSFLMCLLWAEMGAVDVAFTEATVGAGISTVVMIATIFNLKEKVVRLMKKLSLFQFFWWVLCLFMRPKISPSGVTRRPGFRSPLSSHFISNTGVDTEVPNMVTAVLADYRGFDTMFETVVVFIAGMAVLAILKNSSGRIRKRKFSILKRNQILLSPIRFVCSFRSFKSLPFMYWPTAMSVRGAVFREAW